MMSASLPGVLPAIRQAPTSLFGPFAMTPPPLTCITRLAGSMVLPASQPFHRTTPSEGRKEAFIFDIYAFASSSETFSGDVSLWFPTWGSYCRRNSSCDACGDISVGDSGSPTFLLLNNELVLVGGWWYCYVIGSWQGNFL